MPEQTIGIFKKYKIEKANGDLIDPDAQYFILRLDTDVHARVATLAYAKSCNEENPDLAQDLWNLVTELTVKLAKPYMSD
jgi:hypothetical protein